MQILTANISLVNTKNKHILANKAFGEDLNLQSETTLDQMSKLAKVMQKMTLTE